ncbi:MAG: insulinase family protein [Thiotrichales bacterium]|nr:insulinase family protein [Thiotrichales bacterium]
MRSKWFFILALFSAEVLAGPRIQTWETAAGSRVLLVEAHELPMLDIQVLFDAGGSRNGAKPGLAALTNRLLAEGADGLDADAISLGFESLGAVYGRSAGYDSAMVSLRSLSDPAKRDPALTNLVRVLAQPDFPGAAFARELKRMQIGLLSKKQNPGSLASEAFYASTFGDHPYAFPNGGTEESLNSITLADVQAFHQQYYVAANAVIAMVGAVSRGDAEQIAERLTAKLPGGERPAPVPDVSPLAGSERVHLDHPSQQTHILMGQPGIKRGDADYFPLYVGNHVLGGGGFISRLFEEIRDKRGLSYTAYSYFNPMKQTGPFVAGLQTRADQAEEAIRVLKENLQRFIAEGPTEQELIDSKKNITGGFPLRIDSNGKILGYLAAIGVYDLPLDYLDTFNDKVNAVTVDQIRDAFQRRLSPDNFITVMVGPQTPAGEDQGG